MISGWNFVGAFCYWAQQEIHAHSVPSMEHYHAGISGKLRPLILSISGGPRARLSHHSPERQASLQHRGGRNNPPLHLRRGSNVPSPESHPL